MSQGFESLGETAPAFDTVNEPWGWQGMPAEAPARVVTDPRYTARAARANLQALGREGGNLLSLSGPSMMAQPVFPAAGDDGE